MQENVTQRSLFFHGSRRQLKTFVLCYLDIKLFLFLISQVFFSKFKQDISNIVLITILFYV